MPRIAPVDRVKIFLRRLPPDAAVLLGAVRVRRKALILESSTDLTDRRAGHQAAEQTTRRPADHLIGHIASYALVARQMTCQSPYTFARLVAGSSARRYHQPDAVKDRKSTRLNSRHL